LALDPLALARPEIQGLLPVTSGPPADEVERRPGGLPLVELGANENALGPSPRALEAIARAALRGHRYPDAGGAHLKRRLAERLGVTPAHLALGAGSNELIDLLAQVFVRPEDEVVTSEPTFIMYGMAIRKAGGVRIAVPGADGGRTHDLERMLLAIGPRTRMVILCNPNNPTGALIERTAFERFLERVPAPIVLVCDEAYHEYVEDPEYPRGHAYLALERPLYVLRTFSKIHSLAGLRVGYAVARPEWVGLIDRVRLPYNVSGVGQAAALAALDDADHVAASLDLARRGRAALLHDLPALGITAFPSHTNFVLADFGRDCRPACAALEARGVRIRNLGAWGMDPRFARIGIGTEPEHARLLEALAGSRAQGAA
jgi:histidinol-phosphate aminotransferase